MLQRAIKKAPQRQKRFVNYRKMKTVLLIFESDAQERNAAIKNIMTDLKEDNKSVVAWGFINSKEIASAILPTYNLLGLHDVDTLMRPLQTQLNNLHEMHFDVAIDLSTEHNIVTRYLLLNAQADCKIGMRTENEENTMLDFTLSYSPEQIPSSIEANHDTAIYYFWHNLLPYLQNIQS